MNPSDSNAPGVQNPESRENSLYLTFFLDEEMFAIDILAAREVLSVGKITPLPESAEYVAGVINLRGQVVPVIDLRRKLGLPAVPVSDDSAIIILEVLRKDRTCIMGVLVDAIKGVRRFESGSIQPPPESGLQLHRDVTEALAHTDDRFVIILDASRVTADEPHA